MRTEEGNRLIFVNTEVSVTIFCAHILLESLKSHIKANYARWLTKVIYSLKAWMFRMSIQDDKERREGHSIHLSLHSYFVGQEMV